MYRRCFLLEATNEPVCGIAIYTPSERATRNESVTIAPLAHSMWIASPVVNHSGTLQNTTAGVLLRREAVDSYSVDATIGGPLLLLLRRSIPYTTLLVQWGQSSPTFEDTTMIAGSAAAISTKRGGDSAVTISHSPATFPCTALIYRSIDEALVHV